MLCNFAAYIRECLIFFMSIHSLLRTLVLPVTGWVNQSKAKCMFATLLSHTLFLFVVNSIVVDNAVAAGASDSRFNTGLVRLGLLTPFGPQFCTPKYPWRTVLYPNLSPYPLTTILYHNVNPLTTTPYHHLPPLAL